MISTTNVDPRQTQDVSGVIQVAQRITEEADKRNWGALRDCFAPRVVLDYGTPELLTPEEIVARWKPLLSEFDQTEHSVLIDVVRQEPESARVSATFRASHRINRVAGGDEWTLTGRYDYELMQLGGAWKVTRMHMTPVESTGNTGLLAEARARAGVPGRPEAPMNSEPTILLLDHDPMLISLCGSATGGNLTSVGVGLVLSSSHCSAAASSKTALNNDVFEP